MTNHQEFATYLLFLWLVDDNSFLGEASHDNPIYIL